MAVLSNDGIRAGASSVTAEEYLVKNSIRFDEEFKTSLSKFTTEKDAPDRDKWTVSMWVKFNLLWKVQYLLSAACWEPYYTRFYLNADNILVYEDHDKTLTGVNSLDDDAGWYHIVLARDCHQATDSNRIKIWVNGKDYALTGTYPVQHSPYNGWNSIQSTHRIGSNITGVGQNAKRSEGSDWGNFLLADFRLINGLQLHPNSFAKTNSNGYWEPTDFVDLYNISGTKTITYAAHLAATINTNKEWSVGENMDSGTDYTSYNSALLHGGMEINASSGYKQLTSASWSCTSELLMLFNGGSSTTITLKDGNNNEYQFKTENANFWRVLLDSDDQNGDPFTGTLTGPIYIKTSYGGHAVRGLRIDGEHAQQWYHGSQGGTSCHLKFEDGTNDAQLTQDTHNAERGQDFFEYCPDALPIRATTDSLGWVVDGSNFRTDPHKDYLTLAMPLNGNTNDYHATIKGSGTNKTFTAVNVGSDTRDPKFYDSCSVWNGSSTKLYSSSSFIDDGATSFTIEFWFRQNEENDMVQGNIIDTGNRGANDGLYIQISSRVFYTGTGGGGNQINGQTKSGRGEWCHFALVKSGTNATVYVDGIEQGTKTNWPNNTYSEYSERRIGFTLQNSAYDNGINGALQDLRCYSGLAKYTASFKPPKRNSWYTNNIQVVAQDTSLNPTSALMKSINYTGTGTNVGTRTHTVGFHPNMLWINKTDASQGFRIFVEGVETTGGEAGSKEFLSYTANIEGNANTQNMTTTGWVDQDVDNETNNSSHNYVAIAFAGSADGSFTTNTSRNVDADINVNSIGTQSMIKYTGTGTNNHYVPHGLRTTPFMIWGRRLNEYVPFEVYTNLLDNSWDKFDDGLANDGPKSDFANAQADSTGFKQLQAGSGDNMIVYAFAQKDGYLKAGTYEGNQNSNGPTITGVGFKPVMVLIKGFDSGKPFALYHKETNHSLNSNTSNTLSKSWSMNSNSNIGTSNGDILLTDDGFQVKTNGQVINKSSTKFMYVCWAGDEAQQVTSEFFDQLKDSPKDYIDPTDATNISSNYCQLHGPAWDAEPIMGGSTFGNAGGSYDTLRGTIPVNSGKWYWEVIVRAQSGGNQVFAGVTETEYFLTNQLAGTTNGSGDSYVYQMDGKKNINNTQTNYGNSWSTVGDIIGFALDLDNGTLECYKNGTSQGQLSNALTDGADYVPYIQGNGSVQRIEVNFGQKAFTYTNAGTNRPASTFKALCTANLPTPVIAKPNQHVDTAIYTGTGNELAINDFSFQPALVLAKSRDVAGNWQLYDAIRTATKEIALNDTGGESTVAQGLKSFDNDGFTLGTDSVLNTNTKLYVAYGWKASSVTPSTAGSINGSAQYVNDTAGFSMTKYTGNNTNGATVGHGLSAAPDFYTVKRIDGDGEDWMVYHNAPGATHKIRLNTDNASDADDIWADTAPDATKISLKNNDNVNGSSKDYMLYAWRSIPGYSKFGKYEGSGNYVLGTQILLGFKPAILFIKNIDTGSSSWVVCDAERASNTAKTNADRALAFDSDAIETTNDDIAINFQANGFRIRDSGVRMNDSNTYLYGAWAEFPQKYANAVYHTN